MDEALAKHDDAESAALYLAIWIANYAASASGHVPDSLIEAYRRVRRMADEEAEGG